jgi:hypothetical protein
MIASGVLALAGLSGVVVGDMQLRNIGIASRLMNTSAIRLNALVCGDAKVCTATISATIRGAMTRIRISRIKNHGSPIGCCGACSDNNPAVSVTAYTTPNNAVPTADEIPSLRAFAVNPRAISLPDPRFIDQA